MLKSLLLPPEALLIVVLALLPRCGQTLGSADHVAVDPLPGLTRQGASPGGFNGWNNWFAKLNGETNTSAGFLDFRIFRFRNCSFVLWGILYLRNQVSINRFSV